MVHTWYCTCASCACTCYARTFACTCYARVLVLYGMACGSQIQFVNLIC